MFVVVKAIKNCFYFIIFNRTLFFTGFKVLAVIDTESYTVGGKKQSHKYILAQRLDSYSVLKWALLICLKIFFFLHTDRFKAYNTIMLWFVFYLFFRCHFLLWYIMPHSSASSRMSRWTSGKWINSFFPTLCRWSFKSRVLTCTCYWMLFI